MKNFPLTPSAKRIGLCLVVILSIQSSGLFIPAAIGQDEELRDGVLTAIQRAQKFLIRKQNAKGAWPDERGRYTTGVTALALLALLSSKVAVTDPAVKRGLNYLRSLPGNEPNSTYERSLVIMALAAAKEPGRDLGRMTELASVLEKTQIKTGTGIGLWDYDRANGRGDRSNGQFAILGLRDAANAGVPISRRVWENVRKQWERGQNTDGGWGYTPSQKSTGSMTMAGLASVAIARQMLREHSLLNPDGSPVCCEQEEADQIIERGVRWMASRFSVGHNPGVAHWHLYYLYGMERAGRLNGLRFFGEHDWYRAGARYLVDKQSIRGIVQGTGTQEGQPVIGTSLALLFLSKGLAPVLMNKLEYGPIANRQEKTTSTDWNNHPLDARNLTELISTRPKWPHLLTSQVLNIHKLTDQNALSELRQAPVLYITGEEAPQISEQHAGWLRKYVDQGGFIFAVGNCSTVAFEDGFKVLVSRMFPEGDADLQPLPADHPIYRAEHLLDPDKIPLFGVDFGCRTSIVYSPEDLSCLWDKWTPVALQPADANNKAMLNLRLKITRATRIGTNVIAYATGREPPQKLDVAEVKAEAREQKIERGLLRLAKLRHTGGWDTAPRALRNLLQSLNQTVGVRASTKPERLAISDEIGKFPIVYMHGRYRFNLSKTERDRLRRHLEQGGVLFADACCGSSQFDRAFRDLIAQMFPEQKFARIPADHEIFSAEVGHDIRRVRRRVSQAGGRTSIENRAEQGEPFLEGIQIEDRYAVIYSKYDLSCALEKQSTAACDGYIEEDAYRIAINIVLYAMLQEL